VRPFCVGWRYGSRMASVQDLRHRFITADTVYGSILFAALVAVVSDEDSDALEVLVVSVFSLVVFWLAHVYAGTITGHGKELKMGAAFRASVRHSSGMLFAAILPAVPLVLGAFHVLGEDDAIDLCLLIVTVILGVLGFLSFAERGYRIPMRIVGALTTAFFGVLIIGLNTAVH